MSAKTVEVMQAIHGADVFANYGSLLPLDLQGWNSGHQAFRDIITKNHPAVVIDVGSGNRRFFWLASYARPVRTEQ
jgi:hypothetical protein